MPTSPGETPPTGPRVEGLAGVILWTSADRFEAMRRFYVEQVGLQPQPTKRQGHVAFSWGAPPRHVRLIVGVHDAVSGVNPEPERVMVNLLAPDVPALVDAMQHRGVTFVEVSQQSWGGWIATFRDPDGNTIQLLQPAEPKD